MNKIKILSTLVVSILANPVFAKKTVGELLSNVGLESRGGKLSSQNKGAYKISSPGEMKFEKQAEQHNLEAIKPTKSYEIMNSQNPRELPTEILETIFKSLLPNPHLFATAHSNDGLRDPYNPLDLLNVCLVNRKFLEIAIP